jgi:hypothetical protein
MIRIFDFSFGEFPVPGSLFALILVTEVRSSLFSRGRQGNSARAQRDLKRDECTLIERDL